MASPRPNCLTFCRFATSSSLSSWSTFSFQCPGNTPTSQFSTRPTGTLRCPVPQNRNWVRPPADHAHSSVLGMDTSSAPNTDSVSRRGDALSRTTPRSKPVQTENCPRRRKILCRRPGQVLARGCTRSSCPRSRTGYSWRMRTMKKRSVTSW